MWYVCFTYFLSQPRRLVENEVTKETTSFVTSFGVSSRSFKGSSKVCKKSSCKIRPHSFWYQDYIIYLCICWSNLALMVLDDLSLTCFFGPRCLTTWLKESVRGVHKTRTRWGPYCPLQIHSMSYRQLSCVPYITIPGKMCVRYNVSGFRVSLVLPTPTNCAGFTNLMFFAKRCFIYQ